MQNILKNFDKSRAGYDLLEKALGHMTDMAHHINEMKRRHEHAVRIQEVQSQLEDYAGEDLTRLGELVLEVSQGQGGASPGQSEVRGDLTRSVRDKGGGASTGQSEVRGGTHQVSQR